MAMCSVFNWALFGTEQENETIQAGFFLGLK